MKKFIVVCLIILNIFCLKYSYWFNKVWVYATVWSLNQAHIVVSVSPNSDPKLLQRSKTQLYSLKISDNEKDNLSYTITSDDWYLNLDSWVINSSDYALNNWFAYINFLYLAPGVPPSGNFTKIYITINDWTNVVVKKLNLYIY